MLRLHRGKVGEDLADEVGQAKCCYRRPLVFLAFVFAFADRI
jgi:hypothetical protein